MDIKLSDIIIFSIGFLAQFLFFTRSFIQWFKTEKAGKILSPVLFWQISLIASSVMIIYGILRKDPAIILGQFITFYIYIRNLQLQNEWKKMPVYFRYIIPFIPILCLTYIFTSDKNNFKQIIFNTEIGGWLMAFGVLAQLVFTFRFVYQWIIAEKIKSSPLPPGFWYISLTGAIMTIIYASLRLDPVLLLSNSTGLFMYARNIIINYTGKGILNKNMNPIN